LLVVSGGSEPQISVAETFEIGDWQEVAAVEFAAIGSESIHLRGVVAGPDVAGWREPTGHQRNIQDVPSAIRPLALDPQEPVADFEDQIAAVSFDHRPVDADLEIGCCRRDLQLGEPTFLRRCQLHPDTNTSSCTGRKTSAARDELRHVEALRRSR